MKNFFFILLLYLPILTSAQTGTIKGTVTDKQSEVPLEGASVELLGAEATGAVTDASGVFRLTNVPLGRQTLRISYIGFETITIPNVEVTAGKEVVVAVSLLESFNQLDAVVLTSETAKDKALNKAAAVSARQFGLEEVTRFSGGRGDVGRLAANFAGVSAPNDSRNDIVVRGNSPTGLLWRLEGIPIPNPNHFSAAGTTGGPVSAVNPNVLKNSDFLTSAFPAEFGNALGGVFDLGFRKGNTDTHEFTAQVGAFTGVEVMGEGPINQKNGSFLIAARYSLVGLLGAGAGGTSATPNYGDLSFNVDFGKSKAGNFSLFGILGTSDIDFLGDDIDKTDLFAAEDEDLFVRSKFAASGIKHQFQLNENTYWRSIASVSFSESNITANRYINKDTPQERRILFTDSDNVENRLAFSTLLNSKFSNRFTLRSGALWERFGIESLLRDRLKQPDNDGDGDPDLFTFRDFNESLSIVQPFVQGQWRVSEKLTLNAGLHGQYATINKQWVAEPRVSAEYSLSDKQSISAGYGLHHQLIPLPILFLNENIDGENVQTNRNLDFVRSNHFVLGYNLVPAPNWRAKLEVYYQSISNAAVQPFPSSYSSLTEGADFVFDNDRVSLVNEGTGYNTGVEITVERFFYNGFYALLTGSFFESKYTGSDGVERNTPFNNQYVTNLLAGKEFKIGAMQQNVLFFDTRVSFAGGRFYTPVDLEASRNAGYEILQEELAFSRQYDGYFRWDMKFGIKLNSRSKKRSQQFFVDLQNITNNANVFTDRFNRLTGNVDTVNQIGFFPDVGYRLQF